MAGIMHLSVFCIPIFLTVCGDFIEAAGSNCLQTVTVDVNFISGDNSCNSNGSVCNSLQAAINASWRIASEDTESCVTVNIPSGTHFLTAPVDFENRSVQFVGLSENTVVSCNYTSDTVNYTWSFSWSRSITVDGLAFEGCPFPFRFDTVVNVTVNNCIFR